MPQIDATLRQSRRSADRKYSSLLMIGDSGGCSRMRGKSELMNRAQQIDAAAITSVLRGTRE